MNTLNPTPLQADLIRRTFRLKPTEQLPALTPVEGGITNHSYRFQCRGQDCLLREPGADSKVYVFREQEAAVYQAIIPLAISDEILALEPETGRKISRFWESARVADPRNSDDVKCCMATLRRFHGCKAVVPHQHHLYWLCRLYLDWMHKKSFYPDHSKVQKYCMDMEPILMQYASQESVLCHCDTVAANFLFFPQNGKEELRIIDWEYAGMADPAIDLGMFANDACYTQQETDTLIRCYLGKEPSLDFSLRVYGYLALTAITWSNWAEYICTQGAEDFVEYGQNQFQNARLYSRLFWELAPQVELEDKYGSH